jgi:hypothetical protein
MSQLENSISSTGVTDFVLDGITGTPQDAYGNLLFTGFEYGTVNTVNITDL